MVLHYTAMTSAERARDWLCNPDAQVSAHYVICPHGTVWQLVEEDKRAWHAGAGRWGKIEDVNSRSIGIEISNTGSTPFAARQMDAVETLLAGILSRHDIPAQNVIAHSDLAPGRKIDPGPKFDWRRLARQDLSIWPKPAEPGDFLTDARRFGYTSDVAPETILHSFRLRFRPGAQGACEDADSALMADLANRFSASSC